MPRSDRSKHRSAESKDGNRVRRYWSAEVMQKSDALDLEPGIFAADDPERIARSLKRSAEESTRRKAGPFQSAMSMLNLYINRAGRNLPPERREILLQAKSSLRRLYRRG
jgi:Protein of unknown function (DUF3175)